MEIRSTPLATRLILAAILAAGFLLRLYRLDHQSVWSDEAVSITVSAKPLASLTGLLIQRDRQPPLHSYLLHFVFAAFGYGALQARALSLVLGALSIVALYLLARRLFDARTGLISALLLTVSQLGVAYSQEARPYSLLLLLSILAAYLFASALRLRNRLWWCAFVACAVLLMYTHYYAAFILIALCLAGILCRKRYPIPPAWWAWGLVVAALCYTPWLLSGAIQSMLARSGGTAHPGQVSSLSVRWYTPIAILNWFNNGKVLGFHASSPWWTYLLGGFLFSVPAVLAIKEPFRSKASREGGRRHTESIVFVCLLCVFPLLSVLAIGLIATFYNIRFTVFVVGFYYVLVARGIAALRPGLLRYGLLVLLSAYSLYALRAMYFVPYKENNRDAVAYVASAYTDSDCVIFWPEQRGGGPSIYWQVYQWRHPGIRVRDLSGIRAERADCRRVWLVVDRTWWKNLDTRRLDLGRQLLEQYYSTRARKLYFGAEVVLYERRTG